MSGPATVMPNRAKFLAYPESHSQGTGSLLMHGPLHPGLGISSVHGSLSALTLVLVPPTPLHPHWDPWKRGQPKECWHFMKCLQIPPSKPSRLHLVPRCWDKFCFNPESWAGAYAGHVGSVFISTYQGLLSDLFLCVWEVGPAGLGRVTRLWHGHQ